MPNYPQGTFSYTGGIDGALASILGGWEVTIAHGQTPSSFHVSIPMQEGVPAPAKNGDVILRYGNDTIRLKNCTVQPTGKSPI